MKRGIVKVLLISMVLIISNVSAFAWTLQAEDGISIDCGQFAGSCSYWTAYGGTTRECTVSGTPRCVVASSGYYQMNTSGAAIPANHKCSVSVNVTNLAGETNESLQVTVNGFTQTMADQGSSGTAYYTFPTKFNFTSGNGLDLITFTGPADSVDLDYFVIDNCENLSGSVAIPEFSPSLIAGLGMVTLLGALIYRRKK